MQHTALFAAALLLAACSQGTSTPTPSPAPSPSVTPTPPSPTYRKVAGQWSGSFTPDDGSGAQNFKATLIDKTNGDFTGTATSDTNVGSYPVTGNTVTGKVTVQFVFGSTVTSTGTFTDSTYTGTYTTSTGQTGTTKITKNP